MTDVRVRTFHDGDEAALLALHERAYPSHARRRLEHWRWRYRANPLGLTDIALAEDGEGRVKAVFPGIRLRAVLEGEDCIMGLHGDVAIDLPGERGLGRSRLLAEVIRHFYATFGGGDTVLFWGFPEPPLARLGTRLGLFEPMRDVIVLTRSGGRLPDPPAGLQVVEDDGFGPAVDGLWTACRAEIGTGTVRDAAFLTWRYARHPDVAYRVLAARDAVTDDLRGLLVLRAGGPHVSMLSLMDWLVPLDDAEAETALVAALLRRAAEMGSERVVAWFPPASELFVRFQERHGFVARGTPYREHGRSFRSAVTAAWLQSRWYQTLGDMDFF